MNVVLINTCEYHYPVCLSVRTFVRACVQEELYAALEDLAAKSRECVRPEEVSSSRPTWEESGNYVVPWKPAGLTESRGYTGEELSYPANCGLLSLNEKINARKA